MNRANRGRRSMRQPVTPVCSRRKHRASVGTSISTAQCWFRRLSAKTSRSSRRLGDDMEDPQTLIIAWAVRLAGILPGGTIQTLAQTIGGWNLLQWSDLRHQATQVVPQ